MKESIPKISPEKCLPNQIVVKDVDDVLYRIGLCLTSVRERPKRLPIDSPMFAFAITSIFMMERVITCCIGEDNELVFRMLASTGYFLGIRVYFDIFFILCSILSAGSQVINYWNYKQGIDPTFLRLFRMMSGDVPPKELGLTDSEVVVRLCRRSAKWFKLLAIHNTYWIPFLSSLFVLSVFYYNTTSLELLLYGIPNTIHFTLWGRYYWNFFFYQFLIFHFLCTYLIIKIKALDATARQMTRSGNSVRIRELIGSYHSIANEIVEYNATYWSKFFINFWLSYGLTIILVLYMIIYISMEPITKFIVIYVWLAFVFSFLFFIFKSSSVNQSANDSHNTIASLFSSYSRHSSHLKNTRLSNKIKVCIADSKPFWYAPLQGKFLQ